MNVYFARSPDGGSIWHIVPWQADGSWEYDWDTTSGPNGVFALIARATDEAGNVTTDQVNVIVDNAPPTVSITESWDIWDTARGSVHSNVIPVGSIHLTVECGDQPDRTYDYNANTTTFDFKWDRRCGDGNLAPSGTYTVVLEACDIYNNCDEARGKVDIPFGTLQSVPLTATPMPTIENTEVVQQWYTNPTAMPSTTPTPQAQQSLPVLPVTANGESGDGNIPSGNNQPLLPLAAAALGTSVLLAASSRREEETANAPAAADTTYVEAASLSSIAGVVKETFTGVWEDAVRISAADASTEKSRRIYYVGIEDPLVVLERQRIYSAYMAAVEAFLQIKNKFLAQAVLNKSGDYTYQMKSFRAGEEASRKLYNDSAAAEFAEKGAKYDAYYAATIAAYQEKKEQEEKIQSQKDKLTKMENATKDRNVIKQRDYSEIAKIFHEKESKADEEYEAYKADQWQENYGGNPFAQYSSPNNQHGVNSYDAFHSGRIKPLTEEELEPMPEWMAEMTLSMVPILGDGVGLVREFINLYTTGEMDELNFTLSIIGLAMDLPFDAGVVGDTAVAVLKGFSAMIPSGPAREVLLDTVKLLFDNPEGISAMAGAVWKMMGSEDLVKLLIENPTLMKSVLKNSEYADELLEYGDDAARLVEELGEDAVKEILDSGLTIATNNNYRKLYLEQFPDLPNKWQVHHTLPQKYESIMKSAGINIHDVEYLKGVDPDIHPFITNEWMKWDRALDHTPSAEEITDFAKTIDAEYAKYWFN